MKHLSQIFSDFRMESTSHNSNRVVAALMAVALIWIFWPIISPAMIFLNTIAFLPFNVVYFLVGTLGGMVFMARPSEPVQNSETEADDSEEDDEVEVIKANIFKYQGNLTFDQEVSQDILHFEYYDDFNDEVDDVVILDDDDLEMEDSVEHDESLKEADNTSVCCEECGQLFATKELEDHKETKHPPKKKNIKQFAGGNFFMLAE